MAGRCTSREAVHVWAFPDSHAPPFLLDGATLGIPRPDIAAVFGAPFGAAGFTLVVPDLLPGDCQLVAFARSTVTGQFDGSAARASRFSRRACMKDLRR